MREEVFHSTLHWQSSAEMRSGARRAHALFETDQDFRLAWDIYVCRRCRIIGPESQLKEAKRLGDTQKISFSENSLGDLRATERVLGRRFSAQARVEG